MSIFNIDVKNIFTHYKQDFNVEQINKVNYVLENYSEYPTFQAEKDYFDYISETDDELINMESLALSLEENEELLLKWVEHYPWEVIKSELPVLLDYWAEWCGPCKMIGPILEELASEMDGKIKIVKVDVDSNSQTAVNYAIRSIPTLIIIKDGSVVAQHIGAASKAQLENFINQNI